LSRSQLRRLADHQAESGPPRGPENFGEDSQHQEQPEEKI
jgi:hypothetical protein